MIGQLEAARRGGRDRSRALVAEAELPASGHPQLAGWADAAPVTLARSRPDGWVRLVPAFRH